MPKIVRRFKEWFTYDDAPLWLCFCRFIFVVSFLAFILSFCGPAILVGDPMGCLAYMEIILRTDISFFYIYIIIVLVTFTLTVISGIPVIRYEKKKMKKEINE